MPIGMDQFRQANRPIIEKITTFLDKNPGQAYSLLEIIASCEGYPASDLSAVGLVITMEGGKEKSATWVRYEQAVRDLLIRGTLSQAEMGGTTYYADARPAS